MNITQIHRFWGMCDVAGVEETRVHLVYPHSRFPTDDTDTQAYWRFLYEACLWCVANIHEPWSRMNAEFRFINPDDALVFKLRFG